MRMKSNILHPGAYNLWLSVEGRPLSSFVHCTGISARICVGSKHPEQIASQVYTCITGLPQWLSSKRICPQWRKCSMSHRFEPWVGKIPWRRKWLIHVLNTYQIVYFICSLLYVNYTSISDQISHSFVSDSLQPYELQHTWPPCPSPTPGVHPDSRPSSQWCHPAISSSVVPFSSCPQSLPASESFPMSRLFTWGGQSTGVSALASFLPKNTQDWSPLGWTGWISLQSKGLSRVFSNTTVQKHQFFGAQPSSQSNSHIHTWPQEKP